MSHNVPNDPSPSAQDLSSNEHSASSNESPKITSPSPSPDSPENERPSWKDVMVIRQESRSIWLVGTAHISKSSVELVSEVIQTVQPDRVLVELDARRLEALANPDRWKELDIKTLIKNQQISPLIAQIILASYQKRLGAQMGSLPGMELLEATRVAERLNIPCDLIDRDVRITLKRAWKSTPFFKKFLLLSSMIGGLFDRSTISEEKLDQIKEQDVLSGMLDEIGEIFPDLKRVLIDERDAYMSEKTRQAEGSKLVVVIGAGHGPGMSRHLESNQVQDLEPLEAIPKSAPIGKILGWGIPAAILAMIVMIALKKGTGEAVDASVFWFLANAIPCAIGGIIAAAHPLTIVAGFLAAPFTSLTPVIGAGYVTAFVQAWACPPRVREIQDVSEDIVHAKKWWKNRLLKVFLAFLLPSIGSMIGTWVGGAELIRQLYK